MTGSKTELSVGALRRFHYNEIFRVRSTNVSERCRTRDMTDEH